VVSALRKLLYSLHHVWLLMDRWLSVCNPVYNKPLRSTRPSIPLERANRTDLSGWV